MGGVGQLASAVGMGGRGDGGVMSAPDVEAHEDRGEVQSASSLGGGSLFLQCQRIAGGSDGKKRAVSKGGHNREIKRDGSQDSGEADRRIISNSVFQLEFL